MEFSAAADVSIIDEHPGHGLRPCAPDHLGASSVFLINAILLVIRMPFIGQRANTYAVAATVLQIDLDAFPVIAVPLFAAGLSSRCN